VVFLGYLGTLQPTLSKDMNTPNTAHSKNPLFMNSFFVHVGVSPAHEAPRPFCLNFSAKIGMYCFIRCTRCVYARQCLQMHRICLKTHANITKTPKSCPHSVVFVKSTQIRPARFAPETLQYQNHGKNAIFINGTKRASQEKSEGFCAFLVFWRFRVFRVFSHFPFLSKTSMKCRVFLALRDFSEFHVPKYQSVRFLRFSGGIIRKTLTFPKEFLSKKPQNR